MKTLTTRDLAALALERENEIIEATEALIASGELLGQPPNILATQRLWGTLLSDLPAGAIRAAVFAHLSDPAQAHRWPSPAVLRQHAQAILGARAAEAPLDELDPDAAYRTVKSYVARHGPHTWPGGPVLRQARAALGLTPAAMAERWLDELCARYPETPRATLDQYAGWSLALERGDMDPTQDGERCHLIAVCYGVDALERAARSSPWDELAETAPVLAEVARLQGTVLEWTLVTTDTEAAFRKAFRDAFTAAQDRTARMGRLRVTPGASALRSTMTAEAPARLPAAASAARAPAHTHASAHAPAQPGGRGATTDRRALTAMSDLEQDLVETFAMPAPERAAPARPDLRVVERLADPSAGRTATPMRTPSAEERAQRLAAAFEQEARQKAARAAEGK